jgi:SOS-response transcriptional repressor LexA
MRDSSKILEMYTYIKHYKDTHQNSPSFDQIRQACGISSKSVVDYYMERLQEYNVLVHDGVKNITILNPNWKGL